MRKANRNEELKTLLVNARHSLYPLPCRKIHDLVEITGGLAQMFRGLKSASAMIPPNGAAMTVWLGSLGDMLEPVIKQAELNSADIWQVIQDLDVAYKSFFDENAAQLAKYNRERPVAVSINTGRVRA